MDLKEILAVSGKSGLFKVISHTRNGMIVESLLDQKRIPVYAADKISHLEEISIYTSEQEVPLKEVFKSIFAKESGGKSIDAKSDEKTLREYFEQILPAYDKERVYASDIKKMISWYNLLLENGLMEFKEEEEKKESPDGTETKTDVDQEPSGEETK